MMKFILIASFAAIFVIESAIAQDDTDIGDLAYLVPVVRHVRQANTSSTTTSSVSSEPSSGESDEHRGRGRGHGRGQGKGHGRGNGDK